MKCFDPNFVCLFVLDFFKFEISLNSIDNHAFFCHFNPQITFYEYIPRFFFDIDIRIQTKGSVLSYHTVNNTKKRGNYFPRDEQIVLKDS